MTQMGKTQVSFIITSPTDLVAEGDRIFASHAEWVSRSHHRDGDLALLSYNVVKGPELSNVLDPTSAPTGKISFSLTEVYETQAGLDDHWKTGVEGWTDFTAFVAWASKCDVSALHGSPVAQSLW